MTLDSEARIEGRVQLGRWSLRAAATGPFSLRFCPPVTGSASIRLASPVALGVSPGVRFFRRDGQRSCVPRGVRPRHARVPAWVGADAPARAQLARATGAFRECRELGADMSRHLSNYASWVDLERGPIVSEAAAVGFGPSGRSGTECAAQVSAASSEWPPLPGPESASQRIRLTHRALEPLLDELIRYYGQRRYLDDGMRRGRELHSVAVGSLQAGACAHEDLERDLEAVARAAEREVLEGLEAGVAVEPLICGNGSRAAPAGDGQCARVPTDLLVRQRVVVLANELAATAYGLFAGDSQATLVTFEAQRSALEIAVNSLQAHRFTDCTPERTEGASQRIMAAALAFGRAARQGRSDPMHEALRELDGALSDHAELVRECPRIAP